MTVFTSFFQGGLDEAEKIEPAPIEYTDLNQGNLSHLLFQKCTANLFLFYNIGPYSFFVWQLIQCYSVRNGQTF